MLNKSDVTVLDIGSEHMTLLVLDTKSDYPTVSAFAKQKYSGFQDGEFLSPDEIYPVIKGLIETVFLRFKIKVKKISVSIPGEFTCVVNKNIEKDIERRVTKKDIAELFAIGNTYQNHNNFEVIDIKGVYFKTNTNANRLLDPTGEECDSIAAKVSYTLCERYFTDTIRQVLNTLKIKYNFLSSVISQIKYIAKQYQIEAFKDAIHIEMGFLTTTVCYFMGDRPIDLKTFSLGGASAAADITLVSDIPFSHSYKLYKKANLNLQANEDDFYYIHTGREDFSYEIKSINAILEERIYDIGKNLLAAIVDTGIDLQEDTPIFLSGCSFCQNRGVVDILEAALGKKIEIVTEDLFDDESVENISVLSLIS